MAEDDEADRLEIRVIAAGLYIPYTLNYTYPLHCVVGSGVQREGGGDTGAAECWRRYQPR